MYYHFYKIFTGLNVIHLLLITLACVNRLNIIFIEILYFVFIFYTFIRDKHGKYVHKN